MSLHPDPIEPGLASGLDADLTPDRPLGHDGGVPADLSHAGVVVDKAIEYMVSKQLPPLAIASALLGGSLGVLARTMDQETMLRMLANAADSVRSGELHPQHDMAGPRPEGDAGA